MRFRTLGPVELWARGRRAALPPMQRALLAALLLGANRMVPTSHLVDELWPEPPRSARSVVQGLVWRLRRSLGDGTASLVTCPSGYLLEVQPGEWDVRRFDSLVEEGRAALGDGDAMLASSALDGALALWRGSAFADVPATRPVTAEVARLEETRLTAMELRVETALLLGRGREVLPELRALVARHPLREGLHAQLMRALHRNNQRAEAVASYRRLRATLVAEMGIEPSPLLQRLHQAILAEAAPPGGSLSTAGWSGPPGGRRR